MVRPPSLIVTKLNEKCAIWHWYFEYKGRVVAYLAPQETVVRREID